MRIKILTPSALINEETGRWAGLAEEVDAPRKRGEYLVSIGAAKALDKEPEPDEVDEEPEAEKKAPADPEPEKKAAPVPPARRPLPKTK